jgi:hypothetical protein
MIDRKMEYGEIISVIGDILVELDAEYPVHKRFKPGIGPFGEPQLVKIIAQRLCRRQIPSKTRRCPDLEIEKEWAIEFKIVRPFGDNGREAENWSVNLLHPYSGNVSLVGDAIKLLELREYSKCGLFLIGYEHDPAIIDLNPLLHSFEIIMRDVMKIHLMPRIEARKNGLVHPVHQVLRCVGWELQRTHLNRQK